MKNDVLGLASRIVYDEIVKDGPKIFQGFYTGDERCDSYMFGIFTALEYIAHNAGMTDEFDDMFIMNMIECQKKSKENNMQ